MGTKGGKMKTFVLIFFGVVFYIFGAVAYYWLTTFMFYKTSKFDGTFKEWKEMKEDVTTRVGITTFSTFWPLALTTQILWCIIRILINCFSKLFKKLFGV